MIKQMEKLLEEGKDDLLDEKFHQKLAEEFNRLPNRAGNKAIQMKQVQRWFTKRKNPSSENTDSYHSSEDLVTAVDTSQSVSAAPESSSDMPGDAGEKDPEQAELEFEARSSRDNAWYDVSTFLAHRILSSGEPEVRVRFHGFGAEDDEWVNIKKDVRERSIPLESSECQKVDVGDLVLCFRERSEQAMYFDAHVLEVQRKLHDIRGCRCLFLVRYDHDDSEERVGLKRLCRRPKY
ncbi:protein SAWADEE HOMEODOMAIN HOMOLOG 1 isoform X2 [Asparagus officinalis]|uniref:protein SAWADEE HOMEODOMAIN HOMOLOG 1 isoform X2 n=1 Tax=Asparagus officinalis TaxID=4686 RepID=UPI00098E6EF9|nr:protein SAWADEE HOMEODOMAIN HOMOLOG 1 isoform X2 [Asparagus officinalis]